MRLSGVVAVVVTLGLCVPTAASAQSLAEVAAKEKARREKLKKQAPAAADESKSFSEEDLDKARRSGARIGDRSVGSTASAGSEPDAAAGDSADGGEAEKTEDEIRAEEEAAWRESLATEEANRTRIDEEIATVQRALNDNTQSMFGSARQGRLDRLEEAKALRAEVEARIAALETEGRRNRFRR